MSTEIISNQSVKDIPQKPAATAVAPNRQTAVTESGNEFPQQAEKGVEVSKQELESIIEKLNEHVQNVQRNLNFSVDDTSGKTVIKVVDTNTEELIRQIPSEDALRISESIQEQLDGAGGLILSELA
jgi:flagellar protein FlaG